MEKQHNPTVRLEEALSKEQYWVKFTTYINEHNYLTVYPPYLQSHPNEEPSEAWEGQQIDSETNDAQSSSECEIDSDTNDKQSSPECNLLSQETSLEIEQDGGYLDFVEMLSEVVISKTKEDAQSYTQQLEKISDTQNIAQAFAGVSLQEQQPQLPPQLLPLQLQQKSACVQQEKHQETRKQQSHTPTPI